MRQRLSTSRKTPLRRPILIEFHEQEWLPQSLRRGVTDVLQEVLNRTGYARRVVPLLKDALKQAETRQVVDLCSGSGGPWPALLPLFQGEMDALWLTDKFPNPEAMASFPGVSGPEVSYISESVDAESVPGTLKGFRTVFNSFHHFGPANARKMLRDAVENGQGIAVFELPDRSLSTIGATCLAGLGTFLVVPFVRPFRWALLFWTYLIPAIPAIIWLDGIVSCLRAYTLTELRKLAASSSSHACQWTSGTTGRFLSRVTYLIGVPRQA
jgi:hypothetical protein